VIEQVRAGLVLLAALVAVGPANANSQFVVDPEVGNNAFTAVFDAPIGDPPPPMPQVVEFSTGRYQLREDGGGTAYSWVWIPNPPTAPPADAESIPPAQPPHARLYSWTDDQGVVHLTNLWDDVPPQYRQQVKPPKPGCSESGRCAGAC
jgi:hypothetical protein